MKKPYQLFVAALASLLIFNPVANAQTDKKQVETIVHDYIIQNPDVLVQSLQNYQQKQMEQTQQSFKKIQDEAPQYSDRIFHQANDPIGGNPNGTVSLVVFSDYQCPHCVDMAPVVDSVAKKNPNLRIVYKEFPIRGPMSEFAAKATLAAQKQGKFVQLHDALMKSKKEPLTEASIYAAAQSVGIDVNKLKKDIKDKSVEQQVKDTYKLAQDLKIIFTPVFFIAKTNVNAKSGPNSVIFIPGGVSEDQLNDVISKIGS